MAETLIRMFDLLIIQNFDFTTKTIVIIGKLYVFRLVYNKPINKIPNIALKSTSVIGKVFDSEF